MSNVVHLEIEGQELLNYFGEHTEMKSNSEERHQVDCESNHHGVCAICLNNIVLEQAAVVKGCKHAYCVTCILRWATYKTDPTCPLCKHPFESLYIHRSLDGSIQDYMFEERVCLLLRAPWFKDLIVEKKQEVDDLTDYLYEYDDDEEEEVEDFHCLNCFCQYK